MERATLPKRDVVIGPLPGEKRACKPKDGGMRSARLLCVSALACGALAVACGDAVSPTVSVVDMLFAELDDTWSSSTNPVSVSPGVTHLTNRPSAVACGFNAGTQRFVCPARTQNGLSSTAEFQLLDAGGVPQSTFVNGTTASIRVITDVTGSLPGAGGTTTTMAAHSDEIVSGLISGIHTLNSTGAASFVTASSTNTTTNSALETTSNLVLVIRGDATPYPASGSVITQLFSGLPAAGALLATVTSTFNGTRIVTMVIQTSSLTQTCLIDLKGTTAATCS